MILQALHDLALSWRYVVCPGPRRFALADKVEALVKGKESEEAQRIARIRRQKRKRSKRAKEKVLADKRHVAEIKKGRSFKPGPLDE